MPSQIVKPTLTLETAIAIAHKLSVIASGSSVDDMVNNGIDLKFAKLIERGKEWIIEELSKAGVDCDNPKNYDIQMLYFKTTLLLSVRARFRTEEGGLEYLAKLRG